MVYVTGPVGAGAAVEFPTNVDSAGALKEVLADTDPELDEDRTPDVVIVALKPVDVKVPFCNVDDRDADELKANNWTEGLLDKCDRDAEELVDNDTPESELDDDSLTGDELVEDGWVEEEFGVEDEFLARLELRMLELELELELENPLTEGKLIIASASY